MTPGQVALVRFPFSETETVTFKQRPVLVLANAGVGPEQAIWCVMITGNERRVARPKPGDIPIAEWSGLLDKASVIRTRRVWTAESRDFVRVLGSVQESTLSAVRREVADVLDMTA